jgi:hypothetical protein
VSALPAYNTLVSYDPDTETTIMINGYIPSTSNCPSTLSSRRCSQPSARTKTPILRSATSRSTEIRAERTPYPRYWPMT